MGECEAVVVESGRETVGIGWMCALLELRGGSGLAGLQGKMGWTKLIGEACYKGEADIGRTSQLIQVMTGSLL